MTPSGMAESYNLFSQKLVHMSEENCHCERKRSNLVPYVADGSHEIAASPHGLLAMTEW